LGPVGLLLLEIVETLLTRPWAELVGVIDMDADKAGEDVGRFLKTARQTGIIVSKHPDDVLSRTSPDVVTHATSSEMQTIYPQLENAGTRSEYYFDC
jgi:hypothetical protein